jgi:phosphoribosyl 1,2-cyclic phosphate phosphodiesterase
MGPDLMAASQQHGVSLAGLRYCLQTHAHEDHLDPSHFTSRSRDCGVPAPLLLHYYAGAASLQRLNSALDPEQARPAPEIYARLDLEVHQIAPFQSLSVGPYAVTTVLAAHDPEIVPMLFAIKEGNASLFYGTDTGPLPEETWQALAQGGWRFDVVILDHTFGTAGRSNGHMNAEQFLEQVARMREEGLLAKGARVFAHHLAHHSNPVHPELVALAAPHGYDIAYDGLTIRA